MYSDDESMECIYQPEAPDDGKSENPASSDFIPALSKDKYNKTYEDLREWMKRKGVTTITEQILIDYFTELAENKKPSTLSVFHSMIKATLKSKDNIDISSYSTLFEFIKRKNVGFKPAKAKLFTDEEIEKFINEAPDDDWLDVKIVAIFGVNGAYGSNKLLNIKVEHVKQYDDMCLVTMPKTDTFPKRTFAVTGMCSNMVQKYAALRPEFAKDNRFFVQYKDGKCSVQPIGRNKFMEMPRRIAKYLKLPDLERYSGHSFLKTTGNAASLNSSGYNLLSDPEPEPDNRCTLDYKTGLLNTPAMPVATEIVQSCTRTSNVSKNKANDNNTEHVCSLSCGQVKCAFEENERSVIHAFSVMKPPDYNIVEVTPTLFGSDPICRWIVSYTHITEPVSSVNADETFVDITRSIPSNVKVVQKYIRRNSSQLFAAYVIVYGVNCRCQNQDPLSTQPLDVFSLNEIKYEA